MPDLLPEEIELVHGPGCPVCVAPLEIVDRATHIAGRPGVILVSYGDILRVPGSRSDLFPREGRGGHVRIAYSPMEAVRFAAENPDRQVVFFGIGFETTAPANAMAVLAVNSICSPGSGKTALLVRTLGSYDSSRRVAVLTG